MTQVAMGPTVAMLVVSVCTLTFSLLVIGEQRAEAELNKPGGLNLVDDVGDFFTLIADVATANIDGAPWWIRVPISVVNIVPWLVLIILLILEAIPG